jgi:hypothetical protein
LGGKLGDLPTMKVEADSLAAYARKADSQIQRGRDASAPDIQVSVEYLDEPPTAVRLGARRSAVLPAARSLEAAGLEAVPVIAVAREDLAWFSFEAEAHALLSLVDGRTTVGEILSLVAVAPERAMELLGELEKQRVIAFG